MSINWKYDSIKRKYGFNLNLLEENRFHAIYFIDSLTNSLLLSKKYSNLLETNEDLISNFLSALNTFIKEIKKDKNEEIQEINFKDTRILYERKRRLLIIGISKKTNLQIERSILHEILNDFYNCFENQIDGFSGFVDPAIAKYKKRLENLNLNALAKFNMNL
ncbi:MAG: hypothetical protein ACFFAN_08710 [Promethearchaeota archaeon]